MIDHTTVSSEHNTRIKKYYGQTYDTTFNNLNWNEQITWKTQASRSHLRRIRLPE